MHKSGDQKSTDSCSPDGLRPSIPPCRLSVNIAERTSKSVHSVTLGDVGELSLEHRTQRHGVVQGTITAGTQVQEGDGVGNGVLAVRNVLILPCPPDTVELSVVD